MPVRTPASSRPSVRHRLLGRSIAVAALAVVTAGIAVPAFAATDIQPDAAAVEAPFAASSDTTVAEAADVVAAARTLAAKAKGKVDTVDLEVQIAQLDDADELPQFVAAGFTDLLEDTTADVQTALTAYEKAKAAAAAALEKANTKAGAKAFARAYAADRYGWGDGQFSCLESLWSKESGWNYRAYNAGSGATGIPQALPGSKMASAGSDWKTSAATQIKWGLSYIDRAYGTPCSAWSHSQSTNWY